MAKKSRLLMKKLLLSNIITVGALSFTPFLLVACGTSKSKISEAIGVNDFELVGAEKSGEIRLKSNKVINNNLELSYATGDKNPETLNFNLLAPKNLQTNDQLWIKIALKQASSSEASFETFYLKLHIVLNLSNGQFKNQDLSKINIILAKNLLEIPDSAFEGATLGVDFTLPSVTTIAKAAFKNAKLNPTFTLPPIGLLKIEESAFEGVEFNEQFRLPSSVIILEKRAFANAKLPMGFAVPSLITSLSLELFANATLASDFVISEVVNTIEMGAFKGASLQEGFVIPKTIQVIASEAFANIKFNPNQAWFDANNRLVVNQDEPQVGAFIRTR